MEIINGKLVSIGVALFKVLPKNITEINECLFINCKALKEIIIPDGVSEIL